MMWKIGRINKTEKWKQQNCGGMKEGMQRNAEI